jgi:hypothetical protein
LVTIEGSHPTTGAVRCVGFAPRPTGVDLDRWFGSPKCCKGGGRSTPGTPERAEMDRWVGVIVDDLTQPVWLNDPPVGESAYRA